MASWSQFEEQAPELATRARRLLDAHVHKTLATSRRDGSPRISGTELIFHGGDVWLGSMLNAIKARDLQRDPRFALHSGSDDPPGWSGDAKLAGVCEEVADESVKREVHGSDEDSGEGSGGDFHLFRCDLREVVVVGLNDKRDKLVIESWHEGRGLSRIEQ